MKESIDWLREEPLLQGVQPFAVPIEPGVYVFYGHPGFVKIGRAKSIRYRLREIQLACPVELLFLGCLSRDPREERVFHQRFESAWYRGEWFTITPAVAEAIRKAPSIMAYAPYQAKQPPKLVHRSAPVEAGPYIDTWLARALELMRDHAASTSPQAPRTVQRGLDPWWLTALAVMEEFETTLRSAKKKKSRRKK